MIKKILNYFGYISKEDSDTKLRGVREMHEKEVGGLKEQIGKLTTENRLLRADVITLRREEEEAKPEKQLFDINIGDPIPTNDAERKMYVGAVAGFYKDYLEPKLKQMISVAHNMFEEQGSDRDFDLTLKGVVYSFRELMTWGENMYKEHVAYVAENNTEEEGEESPEKTLTERIEELNKE